MSERESWAMMRDNDNENVVTGYMCMIDWECEIGAASGGNKIYPSIEDLKASHTCWEGCGIVEVKVHFSKVICEAKEDYNLDDTEDCPGGHGAQGLR